MIVPTAVSRNTGATASWMSRVTSMTFSGFIRSFSCPPPCLTPSLHHCLAQLVLEMVDVVEGDLQLAAILCGERLVALFLPLADLGLDRGLVDALDLVVHVHVDVECLAERSEQMVLVQLRVAFDRLVLDSGGDLAQLGERLALQLRKSVGHVSSGVIVSDDTVEASAA